jgi:hypothetical protein
VQEEVLEVVLAELVRDGVRESIGVCIEIFYPVPEVVVGVGARTLVAAGMKR